MHLSLYLPGLLWPHTAATGQTPKLAVTEALDNWLRFGNITTAPLSRSQLYAQCLSHPSLLSQCKQELGLSANQAAFFCSPVLQRVDLHSMSISDGSNLNLSKREAVDICRDFNAFIADSGYKFLPYREYLWLVTCPSEPNWFLPPVCDIEGQLKTVPRPQSDDAKVSAQLQTLQAELQMLLAQHPVNQQRKTTYQAEINGVWFWRDLPSAVVTEAPASGTGCDCQAYSPTAMRAQTIARQTTTSFLRRPSPARRGGFFALMRRPWWCRHVRTWTGPLQRACEASGGASR